MALQMIPILMAGLGAARLVAEPLANQLIKKGIGKQVNKGLGRPISKVDDLPPAAQKMFKSPKEVAAQKSSIKFAEAKAKRQSEGAKKAAATRAAKPKTPRVKNEDPTTLMGRTNKARRQAAEAKKARKKEFYDKDLHFGKRSKYVRKKPLSDKAEKQIDNIMRGKEKGAKQARGAIKITPKNQKGMRLPGKDETVKRMGGGKVMKKNMGGSLKAVNNPGLAKLPTPVRNKMGYAKGGGKVMKKNMGGKVVRKDAKKFLEDLEKSDSYKEATKRHARNEKKLRAIAEKKKQDFLDDAKKVGGKASVRQGRPRAAVRNIKASDVDKKRSARMKKNRDSLDPRDRNMPQLKKLKRWMDEGYGNYNKYEGPGSPLESYREGGGKVKGYKKGGPITYRMSGGQVVDNSYD